MQTFQVTAYICRATIEDSLATINQDNDSALHTKVQNAYIQVTDAYTAIGGTIDGEEPKDSLDACRSYIKDLDGQKDAYEIKVSFLKSESLFFPPGMVPN